MADSLNDLLQDPLFLNFAQQRPVATMAQLALRHLLDEQALARVFLDHARSQREDIIPFAALTRMFAQVVLCQEPSVHASITKVLGNLKASHQAVYGKLQRVETNTSQGLVRHSFQRVAGVRKSLGSIPRHDLAGYDTRILDGNHLAATEHRLKETRNGTAAPLPGKTLVVYSPRHDAIADCFPIEDGHAQERSAVGEVLATVRAGQLWVADRNFCTLKFPDGVASAGAAFLVRQHGQLVGRPLGTPQRIGRSETGEVCEQEFQLPEYDGPSRIVRLVTVKLDRPTRDGDREVCLLTNLPGEIDALAVAEQYRGRWRIETVMQRLTESFRCEIRPLCYPKAALFGFAIALTTYNVLSLVQGATRATQGREAVAVLSHYYLALEIAQAGDGLLIALPEDRWSCVASATSAELAEALSAVAGKMNLKPYAKSPRGPKKPKAKPKHERRKVHVSTKKLLDARKV